MYRQMGESNAVNVRQPRLRLKTWDAARQAYISTLTPEEQARGSVPATYQVLPFHSELPP